MTFLVGEILNLIESEEYVKLFLRNFFSKCLNVEGSYLSKIEKTQIKWFDINELAKRRSEFRSFYRNIIDLILKNKTELEQFAKKCIKSKHSN